jgi:hypothetical protein
MNNPLKKEREDFINNDTTTADIAQGTGNQPAETGIESGRPELVQPERSDSGRAAIARSEA